MALGDAPERPDDGQRLKRIGLYGGTFDPIHLGHLIVAEEARARLSLERVFFIPARVSPLKLEGTLFSAEQRCQMVALAICDHEQFSLSRIDVDRQGPSFTVDTLRAFRGRYGPEAAIYFIMGMDSLCSIGDWHQPEEIIRLAQIAAISRPGFEPDLSELDRAVPGLSAVTTVLPTLSIGISSTDIRRRIQIGLPLRYQVPARVVRYIENSPLRKDVPLEP